MVSRVSHERLYEVIVGSSEPVTRDKLWCKIGGRYSSIFDLGTRNKATSEDCNTTPLCTSVVKSEFMVGVRASVIPNYT